MLKWPVKYIYIYFNIGGNEKFTDIKRQTLKARRLQKHTEIRHVS